MKCEKCLHYDACTHLIDTEVEKLNPCKSFTEKTKWICLPQDLGKEVWVLAQPCGGCKAFNEALTEEFIEACQKCRKWEIGKCNFDYDLIPEFGQYVFLTKEEAEKKLEELMKYE